MMNFVVILVGKGGTREEPAACTFKKVVQYDTSEEHKIVQQMDKRYYT
jgi:hypothetical protein